ncbi:MAG: hypothetical protein ACLSA6_06165 [Holdemania massiliensis]
MVNRKGETVEPDDQLIYDQLTRQPQYKVKTGGFGREKRMNMISRSILTSRHSIRLRTNVWPIGMTSFMKAAWADWLFGGTMPMNLIQ